MPAAERQQLADKYGGRAVELLRSIGFTLIGALVFSLTVLRFAWTRRDELIAGQSAS